MMNLTRTRRWFVALTLLVGCGTATVSQADNWPEWRGPQGNGISLEKSIPTRWSPEENVLWQKSLPGPAGATPVVWNDNIFLTSVHEDKLLLHAFRTSGKELWTREVSQGNKNVRSDEGNSASPSPSTDGEYVWAMMANGAMACFDFSGNKVWELDLQERYGEFKIQFGMTSTPILYKDRIILQLIHGDFEVETKEAIVVALDKKTGDEIWKADRVTDAYYENEHSYTSPIIYRDNQREYLVTHGSDYVIAHNLDTGKEIWRCGGLNPQDDPKRDYHKTLRFVASPAAVPGMIVAPTAKKGPVFAIRPDLKGDITKNKDALLWTRPRNTPDVPSPLIHDGLVYLCRENGNLVCVDAKTGEQLYEKRTNPGRHRASPVYADGHIYLTSRDGNIAVIKTGREFEMVSNNKMGDSITSSPAISNGRIYLRSFGTLWAIGK